MALFAVPAMLAFAAAITIIGSATRLSSGSARYSVQRVRDDFSTVNSRLGAGLAHGSGGSSKSRSRSAPSLFADPSRLNDPKGADRNGSNSTASLGPIASDVAEPVERGARRARSFVAYNHPPQDMSRRARGGRGGGGGGSAVLTRLHAATEALGNGTHADSGWLAAGGRTNASAGRGSASYASEAGGLPSARALRKQYGRRKFLFPLLDQGPNNQFLQFRVALAKARQLNRTLVLPLWLPHNPKFQHYHPGAPPQPSRDKRLDQIWYPFESAFDPAALAGYVRTIPLLTFHALTGGRLERCYAHEGGASAGVQFETYLRHSRMVCEAYARPPDEENGRAWQSLATIRFVGYHLHDHEVGTRDRYFEYVKPARSVLERANTMAQQHLSAGLAYVAAHVRVADAHWEHSDCHHTLNGAPVHSVSCGDGVRAINYSSIAREVWAAVKRARADSGEAALGQVYLATNMECTDGRVEKIRALLQTRAVRLVCEQSHLRELTANDNFVASLVEQELCARALAFVGSRYSTWTDTVRGMRLHAKRSATYSFEVRCCMRARLPRTDAQLSAHATEGGRQAQRVARAQAPCPHSAGVQPLSPAEPH